jgi:hypothetical protein
VVRVPARGAVAVGRGGVGGLLHEGELPHLVILLDVLGIQQLEKISGVRCCFLVFLLWIKLHLKNESISY